MRVVCVVCVCTCGYHAPAILLSVSGCYEGQWQQNMRHGQGVEKTVVGTEYRGAWNHNRKTDAGQQKLIFGLVQDQVGVG